jgi:hypothetical protein
MIAYLNAGIRMLSCKITIAKEHLLQLLSLS